MRFSVAVFLLHNPSLYVCVDDLGTRKKKLNFLRLIIVILYFKRTLSLHLGSLRARSLAQRRHALKIMLSMR